MRFDPGYYSDAWEDSDDYDWQGSLPRLLLSIKSYSRVEREILYTDSLRRLEKLLKKYDANNADDKKDFTILMNLSALGMIVFLLSKEIHKGKNNES